MAYEFVAFAVALTTPDKAIFDGIHRVLSATDPDEWSLYDDWEDGAVVVGLLPKRAGDSCRWFTLFGDPADDEETLNFIEGLTKAFGELTVVGFYDTSGMSFLLRHESREGGVVTTVHEFEDSAGSAALDRSLAAHYPPGEDKRMRRAVGTIEDEPHALYCLLPGRKVVTPLPPEVNRDDLGWLIEFGYAADSYFPEDEDGDDDNDDEPE